ncbi:MAG: MarR family transcriptional regulator [Nonomuraea sp.]|nr:MarR family transcriptional regulator [Nonomuraea sp.]
MEGKDEIDALAERWAGAGMPPARIAGLELSKRVSRLDGILESALKQELGTLGLTYAEFDVLAALHRVGPPYRMKPSELSRSLLLTSGGISNVLQRLTAAGHVERAANPGDARSRWVQLTPAGLELAGKAMNLSTAVHDEVLADVDPAALRAAADALREVLLAMNRRRRFTP